MNNVGKDSIGAIVFKTFNYLLMMFFVVICIYPMLYVLFASVSDSSQLMAQAGPLVKPLGFDISSYKKVFENEMIMVGYKNTILYLVVGVLINMLLTIMGAYVLSRKNVYFKKYFMLMILITMYFGGGLIPIYLTVKSLGLTNTMWAILLPTALSTYNMFVMRTGFDAVPHSLTEAATIDGAGHMTTLFKVMLPLVKPMLAVICLYYAVGQWNSWFPAAIYLDDRKKFPLQLVLREILVSNDTTSMTSDASMGEVAQVGQTIKYATVIVSTVPILVVYPFLQKYFESGVLIGSIKG